MEETKWLAFFNAILISCFKVSIPLTIMIPTAEIRTDNCVFYALGVHKPKQLNLRFFLSCMQDIDLLLLC